MRDADRKWLTKSGHQAETWCVQLAVPRDLVAKVGRKKLIRSLETRDVKEAQVRRLAVLAEWRAMFDAKRRPVPLEGNPANGTLLQDGAIPDWQASARRWRDAEPSPQADSLIAEAVDDVERQHGPGAAAAFAGVAYRTATPLMEHLDAWLAEAKVTAKTEKQYRADLARFEKWAKARHVATIQAVTKPVASDFRQTLTGKWSTKNRRLSPLMSYWAWLLDRGYVEASPWTRQSFTKEEQTRRGFTDMEMAALVAGATGELREAIVFSALAGGVRFGAVSNLRVRDVRDGWIYIVKDKTAAGTRRIPIHPDLAPILDQRTAGQPDEAKVFPHSKLSERFTALRKRLGIEEKADPDQRQSDVCGHSIRHWATTTMRNNGTDRFVVDVLTGHKSEGETDGRYHDGPTAALLVAGINSIRLPLYPPQPQSC